MLTSLVQTGAMRKMSMCLGSNKKNGLRKDSMRIGAVDDWTRDWSLRVEKQPTGAVRFIARRARHDCGKVANNEHLGSHRAEDTWQERVRLKPMSRAALTRLKDRERDSRGYYEVLYTENAVWAVHMAISRCPFNDRPTAPFAVKSNSPSTITGNHGATARPYAN